MMYHKLLVSALIHRYTTLDESPVMRLHVEEVYDERHLMKFEFKASRPSLIICVSVQHILIMSGRVVMVDAELDLGHTVKHHNHIFQQIVDFIELRSENILIRGDINLLINQTSPKLACSALGAYSILRANNNQLGYKFYDFEGVGGGTPMSIRDRLCEEFEDNSVDGSELELHVQSELNEEICVVVIQRVSDEFIARFDIDWHGKFQWYGENYKPERTVTYNPHLSLVYTITSRDELKRIWGDIL